MSHPREVSPHRSTPAGAVATPATPIWALRQQIAALELDQAQELSDEQAQALLPVLEETRSKVRWGALARRPTGALGRAAPGAPLAKQARATSFETSLAPSWSAPFREPRMAGSRTLRTLVSDPFLFLVKWRAGWHLLPLARA